VESTSTSIALASLPDAPVNEPYSDASVTDTTQIKITIDTFDSTNNGGSSILNYEIQYDDGDNGEYTSVYTLSPSITISTGIERSNTYRVRYRAQNYNGWGDYSDVGYITAATVPSIPDAPIYVSSSSTAIDLQFVPPDDNGGAAISAYTLYYDTIQSTESYA
jgi:titin